MILSSYLEGGAGGAAYRLHQSLRDIGVDSQILAQTKNVYDDTVTVAPKTMLVRELGWLARGANLDRLPLKLYPNRDRTLFSPQWLPDAIPSKVAQFDPDVINLHWICSGFMRIETIPRLNRPLVWTFHDMWAFTGGCHYSEECELYTVSCGACPRLHSSKNRDLSRWVWRRKAKAWKELKLTIVTPSSWLAKCARSSSLFKDARVEVIPYGIDIKKYRPIDRRVAREILGLPHEKRIILFGAWNNEYRKGFHLLLPALQSLAKAGWHDKMELVVFGFFHPNGQIDVNIKTHYLGKLSDATSMALVYSAADVFVAPSLYDNLPNTVLESIACGTPCVAFNAGGMPDMIEHLQNGYLAQPYRYEDLAQGITWVLDDSNRHYRLSRCAREKAEREFTLDLYAERYRDLFHDIVKNHNSKD